MYDILNRSHEAWVAELNKFAHHCFGCLGDCTLCSHDYDLNENYKKYYDIIQAKESVEDLEEFSIAA